MLGVTIYEMQNGEERVVGTIRLVGSSLIAVPEHSFLLQEILSTPAKGDKHNPRPVIAQEDPVQFLKNLHLHYRSPYLSASKVQRIT